MNDEDFLSRWSRRKRAAAAPPVAPADAAPPPVAPPPQPGPPVASAGTPAAAPPEPLPALETLDFDSDFAAFMRPGVDAALRRAALKTLLNDPRFNVMDGLDVYIDDYSLPDPMPEGWIAKLNQDARLGNHEPAVNEESAEAPPREGPGPEVSPEAQVAAAPGPGSGDAAPVPGEEQPRPGSDTSDAGPPPA